MADVDYIDGMINLLKHSPSYENFRSILMKLQHVLVEGKLRLQKKDFNHLRDVVNSLEDMLDDMPEHSSKQKATKGGDSQRKTEFAVTQAPAEPEAQTKKKSISFLGGIFGGRNDPKSPKSPVKSPKAGSSSTMLTGDTGAPQSSQPQAPDEPLLQPQSTAQPGQIQSPNRVQPQPAQPSKQQLNSQAKVMVDKDIGKIIGMLNDLKNNGEVQMLYDLIRSEVTTSSSRSFDIKRDACIGQDLRKEDKEKIIKLVLESGGKDFFKIIPILGESGLGKTALARLVFNDEAVRKQFDLRAWVSVCQGSIDLTLVARNGIKSFVTVKVEDLEMDQTKNVLKQEVEGKRYLLVVDDVWRQEPKKWQTLLDLFKGAAPASRIIAITRFTEVVEAIRTIEKGKTAEEPHVVKPLTGKNSMSLCMQIALDEELKEGKTRVKTVGEEIEEKCEGVPLAIRAAARSLYSIDAQKCEDHLVQLREITESNREKKIMEVLKFCYNRLPSPLKQCFAYCGIFPIGYTIDVQTIIELWIAHGFIRSSSGHEDAEKTGRQYFTELLRRSFFHDAQEDELGIVKSCKMHYLMHELAANHVAEDNMISLDRQEKKKKAEEGSAQSEKSPRHLAFNFFPDSPLTMPSAIDDQALWTILLAHQLSRVSSTDQDISKTWEGTLARTKRLRVLDLHNSGLSTVPKSIASLKYLTFLDLSRNGMKKIGVSVSSLPNLMTLKLSFCEQLEELPSDIGYLGSLRHLVINGCRSLTSMPAGLVKLTSLVTLPLFVVSNRSSSVLSSNTARVVDLKSLYLLGGTLEILSLERLKVPPSVGEILKDREHLQRLSLRWDRDDDAKDAQHDEAWLNALEPHQNIQNLSIVGYSHHSFSPWLRPFRNLIKFSLYNCPKLTTLPSLDELSSLKVLELQSMNALTSVTKESSSSSAVLLPALVQLTLWDCPYLENWTKSDRAPTAEFSVHLMKIDIRYCPSLTFLPNFPYLQDELYLEYASPLLLKMTMTMATAMSKLKSLYLKNVEGIKSLERKWVSKLICLEYLHIKDCPELKSLSEGILALSSLRSLIVENCRELELSESNDHGDNDGKKDLTLRVLTIERIPKLKSLPKWLKDVHTLRVLKLNSCANLETLPEWIDSVSSLDRLVISGCHKLASLPRTLSNLNSLYTLIIDDCPLLLPRLQKETGEDWPQIAYVPNLILKRSI